MHYVLIIHEVADYAVWKTIFDQAASIRRRAGEIRYQLLKHKVDGNIVVHFSQWSSLEAARNFFESPNLQQIRKNAGVKNPTFLYLDELEQGVL